MGCIQSRAVTKPSEDTLPLLSADNNPFKQILLDGTQPPTTYYSVWNIGTSIVFGAYGATIFFGENWTESTDHSMRMKIVHLLCALGINATLAMRFTMAGISDIHTDGRHAVISFKESASRGAIKFTMMAIQTALAIFAAEPFTDMTNTLPWSTEQNFEILKATYFAVNIPMAYTGNGKILGAAGDFLKTEFWRLLRMLPDDHLSDHRKQHIQSKLQMATIQATLNTLVEAKKLTLKDNIQIDGRDRHQLIQTILSDERIASQPHLLKLAKQLLPTLLSTITLYSFTGYVQNMASQSNSLFQIVESIIALISIAGLSIISCTDLSNTVISILYDMIGHKIPLVHGASTLKNILVASGLGGIGIGTYVLAFFTAEASVNLMSAMRPYLSTEYFEFIKLMTYAGTIIFNGTPANELLLNWLQHKARQKWGQQTSGIEHDIQRVIDKINGLTQKKEYNQAYAICEGLQGDNNALGNSSLFRIELTKRLDVPFDADTVNALISPTNDKALTEFRQQTLTGTSTRARWECFSHYILRAGGPVALTIWVIQPVMSSLTLFDDPAINTFIINSVSYLIFSIFMLVDLKIVPLPDRPDPSTCFGRLALASTTLAPAIIGSAVETAILFTAHASGLRKKNEVETLGKVAGATAATATAWRCY